MAGTKADANAETGGGGGSFSEQRLAEKLDKLNSSAASIQTLSQWCIFHRKRARRVVDTWEKQFNSATKDKKVSFLYLSNDILQNSKRKGGEYVNEFWRVLPRSLKHVYENGEEEGKKVVARLKLTVGGMPEKIVTAYQFVLDKHFDEDTALNKCKSIVGVLEKINKDIDDACTHGIQPASSLISDLQEQETTLKQCIEQLVSVGTARMSLINQLKEALSEQESKSELLRHQLQVAQIEAERAMQLRQRHGGALVMNGAGSISSPLMITPPEQTATMMQSLGVRPISPQLQPLHPATSLPTAVSAVGDEPKKTAAAMADKLASLSAPEQVLSSIFSSFVAEQAASMNSGSLSGELSAGPPGFQIEKRPRLEKSVQAGDTVAPPYFGQLTQVQRQIGAVPTSLGGTQPPAQPNQAPGPFPPPPPLPSLLPPLLQQFGQSTGGMIGMGPFAMMAGSMPPPPPLSNILPAGFPRPSGPPPPPPLTPAQNQPQQQQSPQAPQQTPTSTGFFQSSGIGFFPPVQVQQSPSVQRQ
ncbi:protein transport protein sec31-like isoform X2 [Phragmites australis]|uniref:protein transport protein sec31-like isoform X2 n=1 Tax=Phragmites australis TaxID=29695 RepID=UPI002D796B38|nr:protein transport protein sec31-like isoform X2 [Phragmites australis]